MVLEEPIFDEGDKEGTAMFFVPEAEIVEIMEKGANQDAETGTRFMTIKT